MTAHRTPLESLSADERVVLHCLLDHGLSVDQIAQRMKQSPEVVVS